MRVISLSCLLAASLLIGACESAEITGVAAVDQSLEAARADAIAKHGQGHILNFTAPLDGRSEVPSVDTRATGVAKFQLNADATEMRYKLIVSNIENVRMSHIHIGPPDATGPVAVWLYPDGPPPVLIEGRFSGILAEGVITDANAGDGGLSGLVEMMRAGGTYVNVHTVAYPGGEIRGQIDAGNGMR